MSSATQKQLTELYEDISVLLQHIGKIMASLPKTCAARTEAIPYNCAQSCAG